MKFETIKNLFSSESDKKDKKSGKLHAQEPVGAPYIRMNPVEASSIILNEINISSLQQNLKSRLFLDDPFASREILEALARLVLELRERILQYDTILSDDASGRLPSLLLRKIINKTRDSNIPIYFLAGGHGLYFKRAERIEAFLEKKKDKLGKVLLVTEYIATGVSMRNLTDILKKVGIVFDVASVVVAEQTEYEGDVIYGNKGVTSPFFYGREKASGVSKYIERDPARDTVKDQDLAHPQRHKEDPKEERLVREDLDIIAQELVKLFM